MPENTVSEQRVRDGASGRPNSQLGDLHFDRGWFWVLTAIMTWVVFWRIADERARSPYVQVLSWLAVGIAIWVSTNF